MKLRKSFICCLIFCLSACSAYLSKSYTYNVETGDSIKVTLNLTDNLSLSEKDNHFIIKQGDETILEGLFLFKEKAEQFIEDTLSSDAKILKQDEREDVSYIFYEKEGGSEYYFLLIVNDSATGIGLGSLKGEELAWKAFENLTFSKE